MIRYLDEILCSFGSPSAYVLFVGFLLCFLHITVSFTSYSLYFHFSTSLHCCYLNNTENYTFPRKISRCNTYFKNLTLTSSTYELKYNNFTFFQDKCLEGQVYLLLCFFNCATLFGGIVFGIIADKAGRRSALLTALLIHASISILLTFFQNYIYFAILYISEGVFIAGIHYLSFVLLLELLPIRYHLNAAVWTIIFRSGGILIFSLLGWLVKNWYYLQLAISLPGIAYLVYFWILPRSFHWLLSKNKIDLLTSEIERIAGITGHEITASNYDNLKSINKLMIASQRDDSNLSILPPNSLKHKLSICIQYIIWLCMGLTFSTTEILPQIKDSRMLILFGKALITVGMAIFLYVLINRIGPKVIQGLLLIAGGVFCISSVAIEELATASYTYGHRHVGIFVLAMFPSLLNVLSSSIAAVVRACMLYFSAKTFLIGTRCFGMGTCNIWESIGQSAAPFLQILLMSGFGFKLQSVCGVLMIVSGMLTYFLPDYWQMDKQHEQFNDMTDENVTFQTEIDNRRFSNYNKCKDNHGYDIDEDDTISFPGFFPHTRQCHLRNVDETLV